MHIHIRYGLLFMGLFAVMCAIFIWQLVYFGIRTRERRNFFAGLDIPECPGELPEDMLVADEPEPIPKEAFHIARKKELSMDEILDKRNPFSDVTFREDEERRRARELEEFWSQRFYSILREEQPEEDVITFAYIIKERPDLPPPALDSVELEGMPKESLTAEVQAESPLKWKGVLNVEGQRYYFLGSGRKDYAAGYGERVEGYTVHKEEATRLLLEKDGEIYAVERRN
jgi:hypothetical protein